jgi:hypothetical protein
VKLVEDGDGARRDWDPMRAAHLHLLSRYAPDRAFQIEFTPFR